MLQNILAKSGQFLTSEKTVNALGVVGGLASVASVVYGAFRQAEVFKSVKDMHASTLNKIEKMHEEMKNATLN